MTIDRYIFRLGAVVLTALALAGCEVFFPPAIVTAPGLAGGDGQSDPPRSAQSLALSDYYKTVQSDLLSQGLLRTDGGGRGAPFTARDLAANFVRIALFDEYSRQGGRLVARATPSHLRRWQEPVVIGVEFGASVPAGDRRRDLRLIQLYAARLGRLTGHGIWVGGPRPNFHVLILNEDERVAYGPRLRSLVPGIDDETVRTVVAMPRNLFCLVFAFSSADAASPYTKAVAVIRGEHPDLMRHSCIHEELAQGLGLANDSPAARPSIFNDDEEFGLLTTHDEFLLRMLYDPRLRVGMSEAEAAPLVRTMAAEFFAGES